ncbi:MAG: ribosome small subunit-dependent GTPase A [Lamprobacter sp.]|uniref:ribosome small subunit-dependent GTPase A n=1 Tax=Lamprobacter sp. TaxID=3100796 RepID=UPI002B262937|nr:ribosome small subunit-dependent GTPase A [Lamprobacter sp.]MEA3638598.1 ribosome small subunit-dependent GTPase A [Lamprobacter sp.]
MPRRRLSERQIARIERIQDRRRSKVEARAELALSELDEEAERNGLVVVRHGATLLVEDQDGQVHHCVTRQHIGHPVCGDQVVWQPSGPNAGVITAIQPRETLLSRPGTSGQDKPLAANIGLLTIVIAPQPPPTGFLIDQYLVAAERIGVPALILCNKMDLLDDTERAAFLGGLEHYTKIGYRLLPLSLKQDPSIAPLREHFADRSGILVGQSGVGKSSLIKALLPDQAIQIGALSTATGLGRHTTSAATSYRLDSGGRLIDSPGVRSFRLGAIARPELEQGFPEFRPFLGRCRFSDCHHQHEPDCAILMASADGAIAPDRLLAFHQLAKAITRSSE